jgi:hypothetical protein
MVAKARLRSRKAQRFESDAEEGFNEGGGWTGRGEAGRARNLSLTICLYPAHAARRLRLAWKQSAGDTVAEV